MRLLTLAVITTILSVLPLATANAGPTRGTTTILGDQGCAGSGTCDGEAHANLPTDVDVSIATTAPVVPYEYAVLNECQFPDRPNGKYETYERFDLAGPWFDDGGVPHMIVTVNLGPVPEDAECRVSIVKGNSTVKGSVSTYDVLP
jgi:hypothetical protein